MNERLMSSEPDPPPHVLGALHRGHKMEAIHLLREEWDMDFTSAKAFIDRYEESHASPRRDDPANMITEERTGMRLLWVIILATAATAAFFYFA